MTRLAALALLAALTLTGCGGAEPAETASLRASSPVPTTTTATVLIDSSELQASAEADGVVTDEEAEAIVDAQDAEAIVAAAEAEAAFRATRLRIAKGECYSLGIPPTADEWTDHIESRPLTGDPVDVQIAGHEAYIAWIESLPEGCDETDQDNMASAIDSSRQQIERLRSS